MALRIRLAAAMSIALLAVSIPVSAVGAVTYGTAVLAPSKTFPSVVSVWFDKSKSGDPEESAFICTATLIESNVALTAAHCVQGLKGDWYVAVGADSLGQGRFIPVDAVWYSGRYSAKRIANDIGLLHLQSSAGLKKYASVSKVNNVTPKSKLQIVGWGKDQNGDLSKDLNQIKVTLDTQGARTSWGSEFNERTTIAAGRYIKAERLYGGACDGDSGGPLLIAGTVTIVGTVSYGAEGCDAYTPTVFARVSYYSNDISAGLKLIKKKARESSIAPVVETPTTTTNRKTCAAGGTCAVGDIGPGGGIVFYVASTAFTSTGSGCTTNCLYLEVAPQSWGNSGTTCETYGWSTVDPRCEWSGNTETEIRFTGTAIGTGYSNTTAITTQSSTANKAATSARAYNGGSKTDWSLPSKGELNELCKYAKRQTTGTTATICANGGTLRSGFAARSYWSSSEYFACCAWIQNFKSGGQRSNVSKSYDPYVRPVRAFSTTNPTTTNPTTTNPTTTNPTTTNPKTCAAGGTCAVGDIGPGGGTVFYVASTAFTSTGSGCDTNCLYLEVAPQNWSNGGTSCGTTGESDFDPLCAWSGNTGTVIGTTRMTIGTGYSNTTAITTQSSTVNMASTSARAYNGGGKTDWSLPSKGELNELCKYAKQQTTGTTATVCKNSPTLRPGFAVTSVYWSSSESTASTGWLQDFAGGSQLGNPAKTSTSHVRPVRAF